MNLKISLRGTLSQDFARQTLSVRDYLLPKWKTGEIDRHNQDGMLLVYYRREKRDLKKVNFDV